MPGMVQAFCLKRNCTGWLTPAVTARFGLLCSTGAVDATACSSAVEHRAMDPEGAGAAPATPAKFVSPPGGTS